MGKRGGGEKAGVAIIYRVFGGEKKAVFLGISGLWNFSKFRAEGSKVAADGRALE